MARMLQALKNLEAKAARAPVAKRPAPATAGVAPIKETPPATATPAVAASALAVDAVIPRTEAVVDRLNEVVAEELSGVSPSPAVSNVSEPTNSGLTDFSFFGRRADPGPVRAPMPVDNMPVDEQKTSSSPAQVAVGEGLGEIPSNASIGTGETPVPPDTSTGETPVALVGQQPLSSRGRAGAGVGDFLRGMTQLTSGRTGTKPTRSVARPVVTRPAPVAKGPSFSPTVKSASGLERQVRRTLSDRLRSQPVADLVERLSRDFEQTAGKVVAFVAIGSTGSSPGPLLPVAVLLAEQFGKKVLLVDGDTAQCRLSVGLECGQKPGLAELLNRGITSKDCCVPTATNGLTFLPAGQVRHYDVSTAGTVLETTLQELADEYDCVLIEVGEAGNSSAAALARQADATYLVVELGTVETVAAQKALTGLRAAGARVLGCIAT